MKKILIILLFPLTVFGQFTENVVNHRFKETPSGNYFTYNASGNILGKRIPWSMPAVVGAGQDIDIQDLNINANKKVYISWGDGTMERYTGNNTAINHVYSDAGTYRIDIFGDVNDIFIFKSYNHSTKLVDTITATQFPISLTYLFLYNNQLTGVIPDFSANTALTYLFLYNNQLTGYDTLTCSQGIVALYFYNNNITSDNNIYEIFEDIDAVITVPTANLTVNTSGISMGDLTDETHSDAIIAKYTAAGKIATLIFNIP